MTDERPCCAEAAAGIVKKLTIAGGFQVGIANLESVLEEIAGMKLADDNGIKQELLRRVKIYNYVAPSAEEEYSEALLEEYKKLGRQA